MYIRLPYIYMEYTWYIQTENLIGVPDVYDIIYDIKA
jgi:hypothetical protein